MSEIECLLMQKYRLEVDYYFSISYLVQFLSLNGKNKIYELEQDFAYI